MTRQQQPNRAKKLPMLLAGEGLAGPPDIEVLDLTLDSRSVRAGAAFVALPGARTHGVNFAAQAVAAGARVILWEPTPGVAAPSVNDNVACVAVPELTKRLGLIADRFFDAPSRTVRVHGVTGTNGKTTTAYLIAAALQQLGARSAYAGTLGVGPIGALQTTTHTTPDCITVQRALAELRDAGVRSLGMEVSSHALDQHRVAGVRFATAVFTNLTRDHLDYHGTLAAYGEAKAKLFERPELQHAVINADDAFGRALAQRTQARAVTVYGRSAIELAAGARTRRLCATQLSAGPHGLHFDVDGAFGAARVHSRLIGEFNVDNALAALAVLLAEGCELPAAVQALERCAAPPGRMETLSAPDRALAVIDYAHTPDALEKALLAARRHCPGELICVFGCGGERDPGKRPLMGAIAERLADRIVVTDDNPRGEDGERIAADILAGMAHPERAALERDRAAAIAHALTGARPGDLVLIAGKGHEDYQIVGEQRRAFSDREVVAGLFRGRA